MSKRNKPVEKRRRRAAKEKRKQVASATMKAAAAVRRRQYEIGGDPWPCPRCEKNTAPDANHACLYCGFRPKEETAHEDNYEDWTVASLKASVAERMIVGRSKFKTKPDLIDALRKNDRERAKWKQPATVG